MRQAHRITQMTLNTKRSNISHMHVTTTHDFQISVLLYGQSFLRCSPKMTLNTKSPKVPYYTYKRYKISHYWVTGHFGTSAPKWPIWPWTLKSQRYPICMYNCPWFPNFSPFHSKVAIFELWPFWDKCIEWPQMTLNTKRINIPIYILQLRPSPKFYCCASCPAVF